MKQDNVNLSIYSMDHFEILQRILEQEGPQPAVARSCSRHVGYCIKIAPTDKNSNHKCCQINWN